MLHKTRRLAGFDYVEKKPVLWDYMAMKSEIQELTDIVVKFREDRNWQQFHNPKDQALSLVLEAAELMEHFQWKNAEEMTAYLRDHKEEVADELSDVFYWLLTMSHDFDIKLVDAFKKKLAKTAKKYPIKKSKGNHKKYTELK